MTLGWASRSSDRPHPPVLGYYLSTGCRRQRTRRRVERVGGTTRGFAGGFVVANPRRHEIFALRSIEGWGSGGGLGQEFSLSSVGALTPAARDEFSIVSPTHARVRESELGSCCERERSGARCRWSAGTIVSISYYVVLEYLGKIPSRPLVSTSKARRRPAPRPPWLLTPPTSVV